MSKYYKVEDVIRKRAEDLADTSYWEYGNPKNVDEWIEVAEMEFKDLPTIEVSEEVLKATKKFNAYTIADENAEMGMRTMIEPIIEVSEGDVEIVRCEDCIYYDKDALGFRKCTQSGLHVTYDDYCSYGEREEK